MTARASFLEAAKRVLVPFGWIALFAVVGASASAAILLSLPEALGATPWGFAAQGAATAGGFAFATWLVGVRLQRRAWEHWGWRAGGGGGGLAARVVRGAGLGGLMAVVAVGLAMAASRATLRVTPEWAGYAAAAVPVVAGLVGAALFEELLFRGLPLRTLADAFGPWPATVALAVGFGIVHLGNPNVDVFGGVNIALAAVWLSVAFFSPGGMALAWGAHFGWNAGLALLFDAPVSGHGFELPALEYGPGRLAWVDGGSFGPEGGLVATVAMIGGTLALVGRRVRQPASWLVA